MCLLNIPDPTVIENQRKLGKFLYKTGELVELLSKVIHYVIVGASVLGFPKAFASFYAYFIMDKQNDAFELPILLWLVFSTKNNLKLKKSNFYGEINPSLATAIYLFLKFNFKAHILFSLYKRIPFNWQNPFGYSVALILQFIFISYLLHYIACFVTLAFGAYLFATSINRSMKDNLHSISKIAKERKTKESDIFEQLSTFIHGHADIKQLSE